MLAARQGKASRRSPGKKDEASAKAEHGGDGRGKVGSFKGNLAALLVVSLLAAAFLLSSTEEEQETIPLTEALALVEAGEIASAETSDQTLTLLLTREGEETATLAAKYSAAYAEALIDRLLAAEIEVTTQSTPRPSRSATLAGSLLPILLILGILLLILRRSGTLGRMSRTRSSPVTPPETRFKDVAGCDEAIDELRDIVDTLANPERYSKLKARTPRGYLLAGPPGTGKTLLAKAVAGEAGVPFFAVSGSEFVEIFVGQGAGRVRDLFAKARNHDAAIIFIDEIDAVGRSRTAAGTTGANIETENTLNQLLSEMDGFESSGLVVLAATNRPEMLDRALTRAGRFDRTITVPAPDRRGREELLEMYLARHPHARNAAERNDPEGVEPEGVEPEGHKGAGPVDIGGLAGRCVGMTGADIANLVNRAALEAAREGSALVEQKHLESALATLMVGRERKSAVMSERDRKATAWHEAGHAVAALVNPDANDPVVVSIVPRGPAGGVTWMRGSEDLMPTREELEAQLVVSMAGRVGEMIGLDGSYTAGAHNDLKVATELAENMVARWGMGSGGLAVREERILERADLDRQIDEMLQKAQNDAEKILNDNKDLLTRFAGALLEHETLTREQMPTP